MIGVHLAPAAWFLAWATFVGSLAWPAGVLYGRYRRDRRALVLRPPPAAHPRTPVRSTLRSQLDYALALAVAHARADKPPRIDRWAYRDHLIARDPALERLTRRPGQHREQRQAVPA